MSFAAETYALHGCLLRPLAEPVGLSRVLAGLDPWKTLGFGADGLAAYLGREDPALHRFVAERNGELAGVLAVRSPWLRGPYVELLAVLPAVQGFGVGRLLVEWAAAQAAAVSGNLWACVSDFNAPARSFYARMGFAEVAPLPDLVAPGRAEYLLRKRVR